MKNSTKGALAAAAAGSLLLGGAGSLAYWTSTGSVAGSTISSGTMSLTQTTAQSTATACTTWSIAYDGGTAAAFDGASDKIIPGDTLTKTCEYTLNITGKNLAANLTLDNPTLDSAGNVLPDVPTALVSALSGATSVATIGTTTITPTTDLTHTNDGNVVKVVVTVPFDSGTSNTDAQNVTDTLNALAVTLTQKQ